MRLPRPYLTVEPLRSDLEKWPGVVFLEFGADWCGFSRAAQPAITKALSRRPDVFHVKVGDGPGKPLGRSYGIKLWPTLIVLRDGDEIARAVRPTREEISTLLSVVEPPPNAVTRLKMASRRGAASGSRR